MNPAVSVLLPVYNAQRTIEAAITSILRQSFEDFELLIVNDGSTDESARIIKIFRDRRIRLIERPQNGGLISALNEGIREARGELVARQDADDVSAPERLGSQMTAFKGNPRIGAVGTALRLVQSGKVLSQRWSYPETPASSRWQVLFKTPVAHSAVMYRRETVLRIGGYLEDFKYAEDYDLWSRLIEVADIISLPSPMVFYSVDVGGVSREKAQEQRSVHCRIAGRNMRELIGRNVDAPAVDLLACGVDQAGSIRDFEEFADATETCVELFEAFRKTHGDEVFRQGIAADCAWRLRRLVRMLPYHARFRGVSKVWKRAPHFVGARDVARALLPI